MASNGKKNKKKLYIFSGLGLVAIILVLVVVLGSKRENVITVQTEKVSKRKITQVVNASGKIQPETSVKINAEVSGEITELPVKEGDRVKKGDLLVRIKPDQYQAQVDRSEAGLLQAQANLEKAESEFKRGEELFQKKLLSEQEYVNLKTSYKVAKSSYSSALALLRDSKESLSKTSIFAPMDGTVSQLLSELGERVSGSSFTQGTQIMTVADLSMMEARVDVGENDVVLISIGDTTRISVDAYPDRKFNGTVYEIANTAKTTGVGTQEEVTNFEVKIRIIDKDVALRPGMSMTADIETETKSDVFAVPIQSVTTRAPKQEEKKEGEKKDQPQQPQGQTGGFGSAEKAIEVVFTIENGKAKMIPVKRGINDDAYVELSKGVKGGEEVVSGSYKAINRDLEDGLVVKVENTQKKFGMGNLQEKK